MLENVNNASGYLDRDEEGMVLFYDAQWNDDIHHAMHVLITGESDGYYSDYAREPVRHLCRCLAEGFAYQGEYSEYHGAQRGEPSKELPPSAFISFLQNHDQVGNRAFGERIAQLAPAPVLKATMEILLLAPAPPLLFMGEEFGAASPFLFFCDFQGDLASDVKTGRRNEFARFAKFSSPEMREKIPNPNAEQTFLQSKLDWASMTCEPHSAWLHFYRKLLSVRQRTIVPHLRGVAKSRVECCSCVKRCVSIDWTLGDGSVLALRANLGNEQISTASKHSAGPIYCSNRETLQAFEQGRLPSWSVVWLLQE